MLALAATLVLSGALITCICLPMIYGKLPMNSLYGMRTRHTFQSDEAWLHLNEIGGMLFSLLGFPLMLGGTMGFFLTDEYVALVGIATSIIAFASIGFAVYLFVRYSGRYTARMAKDPRN